MSNKPGDQNPAPAGNAEAVLTDDERLDAVARTALSIQAAGGDHEEFLKILRENKTLRAEMKTVLGELARQGDRADAAEARVKELEHTATVACDWAGEMVRLRAEVERLTCLNNDKFRHLKAYSAASKEAERLLRLTCERICETPVAEQSSELGDISLAIDAGLERQKARVAMLEKALREIAINPHSTADPYGDMYGIGVQDGHRCAANIAAAALAGEKP